MNFFFSCRHLIFRTSVNYVNILCAKTLSTSCSVHSNVTAAYNSFVLLLNYECVTLFIVSLQKIVSCWELVCGINTDKSFAVNSHKCRKSCACSKVDCLKSHIEKLVKCEDFC